MTPGLHPARVEVKDRHDADGNRAGEEVYYCGIYVGLVVQIQGGKWLAIPSGTKKASHWAGLERDEKRIEAVKRLAETGVRRMRRSVEAAIR